MFLRTLNVLTDTEIDWIAYCQEVEGFLSGDYNYSNLKGDTGPLVCTLVSKRYPLIEPDPSISDPAGFVYVYWFLYAITDSGRNIRLAQFIFAVAYVLTLAIVLRIYQRSSAVRVATYLALARMSVCLSLVYAAQVPNWVVLLVCLSRRVHSIYMLRLFNDGVAMLFFYAAMLLLIEEQHAWASLWLR